MISENFYKIPFGYEATEKQKKLLDYLLWLTNMHYSSSCEYKRILQVAYSNLDIKKIKKIADLPFIPMSLFKKITLKSINEISIFKTLLSSGTSSQTPSKIVIDKITADLQNKTLFSIVSNYIGYNRMPMIIIDKKSTVNDRLSFNARAAGILGFSRFGRDHFYLLNDKSEIQTEKLKLFLERNSKEKILVFGFTFMLWKYLYRSCMEKNIKLNLNQGIIIHGGGWKKLTDQAVQEDEFKEIFKKNYNISAIHNYYGFIEQVGSIYMECESGYLHAPIFSDIIIRDQKTLKPLNFGKVGFIQAVSILPHSYPGHSVLTEDLGICVGEDDCCCGRLGKYFKVMGRLPHSEIRGCSDTY